jgi:hypothetical protein
MYGKRWNKGGNPSKREDVLLKQYHDRLGGLMITEFNTTKGISGRSRRLDAVRFEGSQIEDNEIYQFDGSLISKYQNLFENQNVDLIEVHDWSFHSLGQLIGKETILRNHWDIQIKNKVLIVDNEQRRSHYDPDNNPDKATEEAFEEFDIEVIVIND